MFEIYAKDKKRKGLPLLNGERVCYHAVKNGVHAARAGGKKTGEEAERRITRENALEFEDVRDTL